MSQDNISIEDRVRDILFDYGSTNKSVNLGEAKSLIMELLIEEKKKSYIEGGIGVLNEQN